MDKVVSRMSKRRYESGEPIYSLADFERYDGMWFRVNFGMTTKTLHRGFIESWQVAILKRFIYGGRLFEAKEVGDEKGTA